MVKVQINASSNSKFLAVFWYVNGDFIGDEDILNGDSVITYGDYMQVDSDHFDIWDKYKNQLDVTMNKEYDYFPRGRVMFNTLIHKFIVVCDRKIANDPHIRSELLKWYGLPNTTVFKTDEHYQSIG